MHVVLNNSHINMFPRKVAINAYVDLEQSSNKVLDLTGAFHLNGNLEQLHV